MTPPTTRPRMFGLLGPGGASFEVGEEMEGDDPASIAVAELDDGRSDGDTLGDCGEAIVVDEILPVTVTVTPDCVIVVIPPFEVLDCEAALGGLETD